MYDHRKYNFVEVAKNSIILYSKLHCLYNFDNVRLFYSFKWNLNHKLNQLFIFWHNLKFEWWDTLFDTLNFYPVLFLIGKKSKFWKEIIICGLRYLAKMCIYDRLTIFNLNLNFTKNYRSNYFNNINCSITYIVNIWKTVRSSEYFINRFRKKLASGNTLFIKNVIK